MGSRHYPLRVTRSAFGIRAQDLRTLARGTWWARRWIAALEAMRLGARFGRGRQYAVSGQVTDLVAAGAHVSASVVGSRPEPYRVTLDFTAAEGAAQARIAEAIRSQPMTLGRLLAGDLPVEVGELFRAEGLPLFPQTEPVGRTPEGKPVWDVAMRCSCPDWSRPCKHMVAVLLLLGEEVARRPATLLALRGVDVEDLVPPDGQEEAATSAALPSGRLGEASLPAAVLPNGGRGATALPGGALLVRRLGAVPFWRGTARCVESLEKMQSRAGAVAREAASGSSIDLRG